MEMEEELESARWKNGFALLAEKSEAQAARIERLEKAIQELLEDQTGDYDFIKWKLKADISQ
jgi:hypothetical protein